MASAAKHISRQTRQLSATCHRTQWLSYRQPPSPSVLTSTQPTTRAFSSSSSAPRDSSSDDKTPSDSAPHFNSTFFARLDANDRATYRTLSATERQQMEKVESALSDELGPDSRYHRELEESIRLAVEETDGDFPDTEVAERAPRMDGFFQMGEKEDIGPDDEWGDDDISSHAHAELEQHREIREYARNAAWEMPLLAHLAQPFTPPTAATPLRFRYTSYLGEQHPAARKVVMEFDPSDLSLSAAASGKLIKLLGPRYNPSNGTARLSAEHFETQAQNKRYLGDVLGALMKEAQDPAADGFVDVPVDFRHHKPKPKLVFPEAWLLTDERKRELEEKRRSRERIEGEKREMDGLVDGVRVIEEGRAVNLGAVEAPVMAHAKAALPKGKMGQREMGQR